MDQVVNQMPAGVAIVEAESGRIVYANARAHELVNRLGRSMPAELTDEFEMFHLDGRPYRRQERPVVRSVTSGEHVVDEEYFYVLPDGGRLSIRCSASPVYDDGGQIVAAVLIMNDVTGQKRAEDERAYHADLLNQMRDAVLATDDRFVLSAWNKGAEQMFGWTAQEVVGRPVYEVLPQGYSDEQQGDELQELTHTGQWRGERVWFAKDGTPVAAEGLTVAVRGEHGQTIGYLCIMRDIAERKAAEEALREAARRTENILESITDLFVAVDRDWRYTYVNDRALTRMRDSRGAALTREDVIGRSMWELFPEAVGSEVERRLRAAMVSRHPAEFELYFAPIHQWVEVHAYPSRSGLSIYYRDVSARRRSEEERERWGRQQAGIAELGLQALDGADLQALMDEACALVGRTLHVELVKVSERLAGGEEMSIRAGTGWHEGVVGFRTEPAGRGSHQGYTLLAGGPVVTEDLRADTRFEPGAVEVEHGAVSAIGVVVQGGDEPYGVLAALSTRRRGFSEDDVNFMQAVANVLAAAVERTRAARALDEARESERSRIARDLHDEALQVLTDALFEADRGVSAGLSADAAERLASALRRVAEHLRAAIYDLRLAGHESRPLPEALGATVAAHRALAVDCEIDLDAVAAIPTGLVDGQTEVLRIVGEALTNARRHSGARHIRVSARRGGSRLRIDVVDDGRGFDPAGGSSGAGAGIHGMRERAALLNGSLDIRSSPGAGTTVRLHLERPGQEPAGADRARVLLVEDHMAVREAIAGMLEREPDLTVVAQAGSLAEARGMLEGVDVAVVDLGLPDGDGADLIRELRDVNPRAHVFVLSASLDPGQISRAADAGAARALNKTAHLDELVDAVRRVLHGDAPPSE
jgi:PAS domain S-box-containing protein